MEDVACSRMKVSVTVATLNQEAKQSQRPRDSSHH